MKELTGGLGAEYAFEAIGSPEAATQAFDMIRNGGTAVIVGMMPLGSEIKLSGPGFLMEKKAIGCMYGSTRFREHMPKLIDLFLKGRLDLSSLVSQRMPLERREPRLRADEGRQGRALGAGDRRGVGRQLAPYFAAHARSMRRRMLGYTMKRRNGSIAAM